MGTALPWHYLEGSANLNINSHLSVIVVLTCLNRNINFNKTTPLGPFKASADERSEGQDGGKPSFEGYRRSRDELGFRRISSLPH